MVVVHNLSTILSHFETAKELRFVRRAVHNKNVNFRAISPFHLRWGMHTARESGIKRIIVEIEAIVGWSCLSPIHKPKHFVFFLSFQRPVF